MTPESINSIISTIVGAKRDYVGCLNAMREAEQVIVDWVAYRIELSKVVGIGYAPDLDICDDIKSFLSATARQRAEAWLRTMGKWKGEP